MRKKHLINNGGFVRLKSCKTGMVGCIVRPSKGGLIGRGCGGKSSRGRRRDLSARQFSQGRTCALGLTSELEGPQLGLTQSVGRICRFGAGNAARAAGSTEMQLHYL
ncbi:hypothetical protein B7486_14525 [cyanobacterium TDX16]|nr:hypothetical protein B7486_14525 [cyanobacterium TDX16]